MNVQSLYKPETRRSQSATSNRTENRVSKGTAAKMARTTYALECDLAKEIES